MFVSYLPKQPVTPQWRKLVLIQAISPVILGVGGTVHSRQYTLRVGVGVAGEALNIPKRRNYIMFPRVIAI